MEKVFKLIIDTIKEAQKELDILNLEIEKTCYITKEQINKIDLAVEKELYIYDLKKAYKTLKKIEEEF